MQLLTFLNSCLLGTCLPPFLLVAGVFFLLRLRAFPYLHPLRTLKRMGGHGGIRGSLTALTVALAGTLGVGNIAGVGVALAVGGAGAVLWMAVGGLLVAILKYAEITLSLDERRGGANRGALNYIEPTLGHGTALLFALLALSLSLFMGSLLQGQVIAEALGTLAPLTPCAAGLLLSGITLLLFLGGRRAVERLSAIVIPLLTALYLLAAFAVLVLHRDALPSVLLRILREALLPKSVGGGMAGAGVVQAIRVGIGRGLFSNEAGAGTAPFAHSAVDVESPARQGLFGIPEVLVDTVLMCPLTAMAVLAVFDPLPSLSGTALVAAAFAKVFGRAGESFILVSIVVFAYATVACWVEYGRLALSHLTQHPIARATYPLIFSGLLTIGAVITADGAFGLCDTVLGIMTLINTTAILKRARRIRALTEAHGLL